ncbi:hypothetical protein HOA91_03505 [Candidatus Woesearchaeota archaeon]|jgi:transposase-like protein|nr:hypothetical protein [Candidatus Woesearchaeota archaeon]
MTCKKCGFDNFIKHGMRTNKYSQKQVYQCKQCNSFFTIKNNLNSIYSFYIIQEVLDHFCQGKSYAKIVSLVNEKEKINLSKSTVHRWVQTVKNKKWQK